MPRTVVVWLWEMQQSSVDLHFSLSDLPVVQFEVHPYQAVITTTNNNNPPGPQSEPTCNSLLAASNLVDTSVLYSRTWGIYDACRYLLPAAGWWYTVHDYTTASNGTHSRFIRYFFSFTSSHTKSFIRLCLTGRLFFCRTRCTVFLLCI